MILTVDVDGVPMGMVCFALPPTQTSQHYGTACWELARLWLDDLMPTNSETWVLGQAVKYVKKNHTDIGALVSYADPTVGHEGTMYLAANWIPDGVTTSKVEYQLREPGLFGEMIKRFGRDAHVPKGAPVEKVMRVSKRRFVYWLKRTKS